MQLQFSKKALRCLGCAVREVRNTEVTQEIRLSDGMPDIGRILTSWGQIMVRSKQWQSGVIELSGGVKVWVLYAPEDGTEPRVTESWIPFQLKWDAQQVEREGPARMMPLLRFVDSRGTSARKMMLRAGVGVLAQGFYPMEAEISVPEDIPEDVQVLQNTYPVRYPVDAGEKIFVMDEDVDLSTMGISGGRIISYTVSPYVSEKRVLSDKLVFKGCANLHLIIRDGEGRLQSRDFDLPFSQLAELDGAYTPEARGDIRLCVTDLEADLNDAGQLRLKCSLVAQYLVDDLQMLELTEDAYSPRRNVSFETSLLELPVMLDEKTEIMKAEQTLTGQIGNVVDARFYPDHARMHQQQDAMELTLPGLFQILYYGEDGALQSGNVRWEGSVQIPTDSANLVLPMVQSSGQVQVMTGPEGMMLSTPVQLQLRTDHGQGLDMMTSMELGELQEDNPNRPSVILRRCVGDSLWNIAKESGSTVSAICRANGITGQPDVNQMLLIPLN